MSLFNKKSSNDVDEFKIDNPFCVRRLPNSQFLGLILFENKLNNKKDGEYTKPTFTDQEAYRVTLASQRGSVQQFLNSPIDKKAYSIPVGKSVDDIIDNSYLRRPDLTLADIDAYINKMQSQLEKADKTLANQIQLELEEAQAKKEEIAVENKSSDKSSEDSV